MVDLLFGKSTIGCKWVYKIKTRSYGTVDRYKACIVARDFTQEYVIRAGNMGQAQLARVGEPENL